MSVLLVIKFLCQLFSLFGMPAYIHSDRGSSFMSEELHQFLMSRGVATSRTTPYNPACNGQVERYNGTIWKTIRMALETCGLPFTHWQDVLPDALHSIRYILCTATNNNHIRDSSDFRGDHLLEDRFQLGFPHQVQSSSSVMCVQIKLTPTQPHPYKQ